MAGVFEFPELINKLQTVFSDSFIQADWTPMFNAVFDASTLDLDDEQNKAALADNSGVTPPTSSTVQVVEDTMEALGVSIRASCMLVLPSRNPKAPSRRSPSPRSHPPTKRCKTTMALIFLDLSADEEDEEDKEDVARSNIAPPVLPTGCAHFSDHVQHLIARYEKRHSSTALTLVVPLESHHIPLPEAQEMRLYLVEFLTSKLGSISSWILNFIHSFQRISQTFTVQSLRIAGYNVIWLQAFCTKCTSKQQVPCRSRESKKVAKPDFPS